jgi:hypothetical protein
MADRITLAVARLAREEAFRADVYDDATGLPLVLPTGGQPTVGYGCRVRQWSPTLASDVLKLQVAERDAELHAYAWYTGIDEARGSVFLDIGFNAGIGGLLHYPKMIAASMHQDWPAMAAECTDRDPKLDASRYAPLRAIILSGNA